MVMDWPESYIAALLAKLSPKPELIEGLSMVGIVKI